MIQNKYFLISIFFHFIIVFFLIAGFDFATPLPVVENTNKNEVISAVVLGDSPSSKLLTKPITEQVKPAQTLMSPSDQAKVTEKQDQVKKDVIAIKIAKQKQLDKQNALAKQRQAQLLKHLLADITNQKKIQQKQLQTQFQQTLKKQAEKSLRQQLLNEDIKLQGTQTRESHGEINKYKALIVQAISEHWVIPSQASKKLYCELLIRLAPDGAVLDVQITKTSGDPSLDSSARAAVLKASPLPVPADPDAFKVFRQFVLKVKPENILNNA